MKKAPVSPIKYIECTEVFDIQDGTLSGYIKIINIISEKYPDVDENDILHHNGYLGNYFLVPFSKNNPNFDQELIEYNSELVIYNKALKRQDVIFNKKEEKEKRRQERIAKNQLLKTISENKTIEVDNKKYKVQLIEIEE